MISIKFKDNSTIFKIQQEIYLQWELFLKFSDRTQTLEKYSAIGGKFI